MVQRRQAADQRLLGPLLDGLDHGAYLALTICLEAALAFRVSAVPSPTDEDLQEAAAALAATRETAARGVIYEHQPASLVAGRLAGVLRDALESPRRSSDRVRGDETIAALRRIERVVTAVRRESAATPTAFLDFLGRVLRPGGDDSAAAERLAAEALADLGGDDSRHQPSRLIVP